MHVHLEKLSESRCFLKFLAETPWRKRPMIQDSSWTGTLSFSQFAICLCFPIFVMFCFCVIIIPILYNCQQNLHLNQLQKFNIGIFPRFLGKKKGRLNIPFSKDIRINA